MAYINNEEIIIFPDTAQLFQIAAKDFKERAVKAVDDKGFFSVVLSGGNTPKLFYNVLATNHKDDIPWQKVHVYFGDERYVPADSEENNYHMAFVNLLSKVNVNPKNIFPIPTDFKDPEQAAEAYAQTIQAHLPFDLIYLGLGEDAHTASLMPATDVVKDLIRNKETRLVASLYLPQKKMYRITLTPRAINNNGDIIFMVCGAQKALAVNEVLHGKKDPLHYPAQLIRSSNGKTLWYLDEKAGEKL